MQFAAESRCCRNGAEAGHAQPSTTPAIYTQVYDRRRDEIRSQMTSGYENVANFEIPFF